MDAALAAYIENRELADLLTAQLAELRASRARIVTAGDAERQRIERALHDGAQQHLTGIAMRLEEARRTPGIEPAMAERLEDERRPSCATRPTSSASWLAGSTRPS